MTTQQLGIDLISEDGKKYHARIEQKGDSPDLTFRMFKDEGVLMHVAEFPAAEITVPGYSRRDFHAKTGVLFYVDGFGILKTWVRMIEDLTR
jgi:hypothetical protein